jgi:hypothetical protein
MAALLAILAALAALQEAQAPEGEPGWLEDHAGFAVRAQVTRISGDSGFADVDLTHLFETGFGAALEYGRTCGGGESWGYGIWGSLAYGLHLGDRRGDGLGNTLEPDTLHVLSLSAGGSVRLAEMFPGGAFPFEILLGGGVAWIPSTDGALSVGGAPATNIEFLQSSFLPLIEVGLRCEFGAPGVLLGFRGQYSMEPEPGEGLSGEPGKITRFHWELGLEYRF